MRSLTLIFAGLAILSRAALAAETAPVRILVWDERQPAQKTAYDGAFLGDTIAAWLAKQPGVTVKSVALDSPDQGLDAATLDATDVLIWWGHMRPHDVAAAHVEDVVKRVTEGKLGFVPLHSAHW
ncbi:MAG: trehalose utilization protein, partial [Verrucomicrobia bacterium]|nr:trehalose utilization protein [Verrucomicrobiota bacterium]